MCALERTLKLIYKISCIINNTLAQSIGLYVRITQFFCVIEISGITFRSMKGNAKGVPPPACRLLMQNRKTYFCTVDSVDGNRKPAGGSCGSPELVGTNAKTGLEDSRKKKKEHSRSPAGLRRAVKRGQRGEGRMPRGWPDTAL